MDTVAGAREATGKRAEGGEAMPAAQSWGLGFHPLETTFTRRKWVGRRTQKRDPTGVIFVTLRSLNVSCLLYKRI